MPQEQGGASFVGRSAELARLRKAWDGVCAGRSGLILLAGEAGVGKTRLLYEFASGVVDPATRVLWGECIDLHEGGLPYAPFRQALRTAIADREDVTLASAVRAAGADLAMLLPSLGPNSPMIGDENVQRVRLFESLLHLLRRLAEDGPLLVVLDDAHWADDTTLDLTTFLARNLSDSAVLLLLTFRPTLVAENPALRDFVASRAGRTVTDQFTLDGFPEHELANFLAELIDDEPQPSFVAEIARRSNGNPLFAQEIVAAGRAGTGVPPSLTQLLLGRTSGLPAEVRSVLRIAAVGGHAIPHDVLQTVSGLSSTALTSALRHAIDADVLVEDPTIRGYAFRHALLQEALYSSLLMHERQALHHSYANALAGRSNDEPLLTGTVATHWDKAGDIGRALAAYVLAADAAKRSFSFSDVERYLARAYELWNDVPDAALQMSLSRRHLANRLLNAAVAVEDHATAVAVGREALSMVDDTPRQAAEAFQRGQLSRALWNASEEAEALDESYIAVSLLGDEPSVEQAWVLTWHAKIVALNGRYSESRALAERAMRAATEAGSPRAYRVALATCGSVMARQGELAAGWQFVNHAELLARKRSDADEIMRIFLLRGEVLQAYGRWAEARDNYAEGISEAAKYGMTRRYVSRFHVLAARMLFLQGRWDEATAEIYQAREHISGRRAALPALMIAMGEFSAAAEFFARERIRWRSDGTGLLQIPDAPVELAVLQRRFGDARESYEHGRNLVAGSEELLPEARLCVAALRGEADAVQALEAERDDDVLQHAFHAIERLRSLGAARPPRHDGFGNELAALVAVGEAEYLRVVGESDPDAWAAAARWWNDLGMPYSAAYASTRQAEALLGRGDRARAEALLSDALATATKLSAAPLSETIQAAQTAAGIAPPTPAPANRDAARGAATVFGLTEREREVATVLTKGFSNREIAEQLFIAEGTASVHVSRILRKLGVTSRGQAIALLLQEGVRPREQ
jgi:DNA-binding CsgD family transcriptional regulator/tetratricopeptide (TPR) repeat protein